jgi:hypothetical protein
MRNNAMATGDINDPRTRLKALCYNPRLEIVGPSTVSSTRLDNLKTPSKSLIIRHAKSPALAGDVLARTSMLRNIRIQWDGDGGYLTAVRGWARSASPRPLTPELIRQGDPAW